MNHYQPVNYIEIADAITENVAATLIKRHNMNLVGITGGMIDCVNILGLSFQIKGPLSKNELRKLIVDCVEEFLCQINNNEKIKPFLKKFPFTEKEISLKIFITDKKQVGLHDPEISIVAQYAGKIWYDTVDKNNIFRYKFSEEEDYETALKIVRDEKKN